jgi:CRP/FNR family transcriptional regulator, cyclic AMP receptor protein
MRALDRRETLNGLGLPAERELMKLARPRFFHPGQYLPPTLFAPDPKFAVLIGDGLVKLTAISTGEHETLLWVRGPGDLLGEHGALRELRGGQRSGAQGARDQAVIGTAMTFIQAWLFPAGTLGRFLRSHPDALAAVALGLWERLEEAEARIASAGRDSADRRLARLLCDLEGYGHPQEDGNGLMMAGTEIPIKLSQQEFATWIGASRETVERALRNWRARGIVSTRYRTIIVHDLESLARIAGITVRRRTWNWPVMPDAVKPRRNAQATPPGSAHRRLGEGLGALIPVGPIRHSGGDAA